MNPKRESLMLAGVQALVLLVCLAAIVWNFLSGLVFNIDGLLLLLISLSLAAVFSFTLFLQARSERWLERLPLPGRKKTSSEAASGAPAAEKVPAGDAK